MEEGNRHPRDNLESHIEDYNEMFGTNYSTDDFGSYYVDVSKRSKNKQIKHFQEQTGLIMLKKHREILSVLEILKKELMKQLDFFQILMLKVM